MQYLYRAFDSDDKLLYVGISGRWSERLHQHEKTSEWMELTDYVKIEKFDTRDAVSEAERTAVEQEKPVYNKQYNQEYESPQNHFQKLKRWFFEGGDDEVHYDIINQMRRSFIEAKFSRKRKKSYDVAWAFFSAFPYLDFNGYIECRNCRAIYSHKMYESWAGISDEAAERNGYYD